VRGDDRFDYNLRAIRELVLAQFTKETFRDLLLGSDRPALKPLLHEFSSDDDLQVMVWKALVYCERRALLPDLLQAVEQSSAHRKPADSPAAVCRHARRAQGSLRSRWTPSTSDMQRWLHLLVIGLHPSVGLSLAVVTGWLDLELTLKHVMLIGSVYLGWAALLTGPKDLIRRLRGQPPRPYSAERSQKTLHRDVALCIGLLWGLLRFPYALKAGAVGDFAWALRTAAALLNRQDPYAFVPSALEIPYPLPVATFGLPLLVMPSLLASMLFVGSSSALLSYGILRKDSAWRLLIFLTPAFFRAIHWAQWSPLIAASWFIPDLAPLLVLIKPQTALPVALNRLTWRGLFLAIVVLSVSLAVYPQWPIRWYRMLADYQRIIPILELPLGPLLLLSAFFPRSTRARLLLLMSLLPMRSVYDLVPLYLVPATGGQMVALVALTWLDPIGRFGVWAGYNWAQMVNSYHFYALCILLYSHREPILSSWLHIKSTLSKWMYRAHRRFARAQCASVDRASRVSQAVASAYPTSALQRSGPAVKAVLRSPLRSLLARMPVTAVLPLNNARHSN
jgi:hypothetical protein